MKNKDGYKNDVTIINDMDDGLVGNPDGTDKNSLGYSKLQDMVKARSKKLTVDEKREIEFNAIRYRMIEYVQNDDTKEMLDAGFFIREYLRAADVKQNVFAQFIDFNPGNLGKLLNGSRKINPETAIILGNVFKIDPQLWLRIQDKNEMVRLNNVKRDAFHKYTIDNLMSLSR